MILTFNYFLFQNGTPTQKLNVPHGILPISHSGSELGPYHGPEFNVMLTPEVSLFRFLAALMTSRKQKGGDLPFRRATLSTSKHKLAAVTHVKNAVVSFFPTSEGVKSSCSSIFSCMVSFVRLLWSFRSSTGRS